MTDYDPKLIELVKKSIPNLMAKDIISVQPIKVPKQVFQNRTINYLLSKFIDGIRK